ncbi:MAG: DUF4302 domain-containing protein [Sphingobacteriaceae bacterium]|nr:DUF4302 domain-containing protein [Sphingobacteriaceae bacterium]
MKKIVIMSFFALFFLQACKKDQTLIDNEKPEERAGKELQKLSNELIQSTNGWVAHVYTSEVKGDYSFYINFKENNVLTIRSDFDDNSFNTEQTSTYRLKKVMATTLIFDTDNYLDVLIDPNSNKGGKPGLGFGSDTEFEIKEQVGDTLKLTGKRRLTRLSLVKATAADKNFYTKSGIDGLSNYLKANPYLYIPDEKDANKKVQILINTDAVNRKVSFSTVEDNIFVSAEQFFAFSTPGISNLPVVYAGRTFVGFEWDKTNQKLFAITSKGDKVEVLVSTTPLTPLHLLIGTKYKSLTVPNQTTYPGWGTDFVTRRATAAKLPYSLKLETLKFDFNNDTKKVVLTVGIPQGTRQFYAYFGYDYTKTSLGVYKFTKDPSYVSPNGNGAIIESAMVPLLTERLTADTFTLDYFAHPTTKVILGQFKSVENPDFTFTGSLQ